MIINVLKAARKIDSKIRGKLYEKKGKIYIQKLFKCVQKEKEICMKFVFYRFSNGYSNGVKPPIKIKL